jgi:hypothetical protein
MDGLSLEDQPSEHLRLRGGEEFTDRCYGPPGIRKTLSALRYSRAEMIVQFDRWTSEARDQLPIDTVLYTASVITRPPGSNFIATILRLDEQTKGVFHVLCRMKSGPSILEQAFCIGASRLLHFRIDSAEIEESPAQTHHTNGGPHSGRHRIIERLRYVALHRLAQL